LVTRTTGRDFTTFRGGVVNEFLNLFNGIHVDHRPLLDARLQPVSDLESGGFLHQLGQERIIDTRLNIHPVRTDTGLARVAELRHHRPLDRLVEIGIVEHDERRVAAQFHRHFLNSISALPDQLLAHLGGAGEGHLAHHRALHHRARDLAGRAGDDVDDALGEAHLFGQRRPGQARIGRRRRRFGHHRAAHGQRRADLARQHRGREIPRRDHAHHTNRMMGHEDAAAVHPCRHDLALGAARFFGEPADILRADGDLAHGFGQRLAHLDGQQFGQVLLVVHQGIVQLPQQADTAHQVHRGKAGEGGLGGGNGAFGFRVARVRDGADHLARGRVCDVDRLATVGCNPVSGDKIRLFHPMLPVCHGPLPFLRRAGHPFRRFAFAMGHCKARLRFPA
jgi:hypothetical protein